MRAAVVGVALVAFVGVAGAQPRDYASDEGAYRVKFPGAPKLVAQNAKSAVGDLTVNIATYADSGGNVFMVSYTDFPEAATRPANHATLFAGVRDGVKGKDGKVPGEEKTIEFGQSKLPGREFTIEKGKQRIRYRVVLSGNRMYQVAAIGTETFATGKEGTAFFDSFQITK
ncbi:MAG: hypothetical protein J0I06_23235 [Planctomycetes bacterium]|nr:hypothetical protein [Planctomycetota bacterium]